MKIYQTLLLSLTCFCACKKNPGIPSNGYDPNNPSFKIGTTWVYHYTGYQPNGSISYEDDITFTIAKDTTINGAKYYVTSNNYYFGNKTSGYYEYDRNLLRENLFYKKPVTTGEMYQGDYLSIPPSTCLLKFNATVGNTDTTYTYSGKVYDKLIGYTLNNFSSNCQSLPTYSKEFYSTKMGLKIFSTFYSGSPSALSQKIELKSFTY